MLKRQIRVDNIIFGMNSLEETQFKVRFASSGFDSIQSKPVVSLCQADL